MLVKLTTNFPEEPIIRQTPGRRGRWDDFEFRINDPDTRECDAWVVLEGLIREDTALVRSGITIFFALEPPATEEYQPGFLNQFDLVIASHQLRWRRNLRNEFQAMPWHAGIDRGAQGDRYLQGMRCTVDYDQFAGMTMVEKPKLMSVIVSTQTFLPGHRDRLQFVERLKERWPGAIDVYGRGINPVTDKLDAIAPYKYHVVMENSVTPHYWSEKIADCFLGFAYPFYWGCPNISEYFPAQSLTTIDITRPDQAIDVIARAIEQDLATTRRASLLEARQLVLERYNTFAVIRKACLSIPPRDPRYVTLRTGQSFYNPHSIRNLARRARRIPRKIRSIIRELSNGRGAGR